MRFQMVMVAIGWLALSFHVEAACGPSAGNTYYISPAGNDLNPCSAGAPCRQIRKPLTAAQPGDVILVADGVYLGFTIDSLNGTATNPITVRALGKGAYVQTSTDRSDNRDNIFITSSSYVIIDGLNSTNAPRSGMRIDSCQHITVRNGNYGSNTTWGIFTDFSDDLLLENNECHHSRQQHGIYHSNSGDRPVIRGNFCHDNMSAGIHMNGDITQGGDGIISGAIVEGNLIVNNGTLGGSGINMDGVQGAIVRNNVLYGNHATGIALFQQNGAEGPASNQVVNNTIDMAADSRWALTVSSPAGVNLVRNNVFQQRNPSHGGIDYPDPATAALTDSDYNFFGGNCFITTNDNDTRVSLAVWQVGGHELHSACVDIANLVVSPLTDYHLKTNSLAINAAQTLANVTLDRDDNSRPVGAASDVGAYEFGGQLATLPVMLSVAGTNCCVSFGTFLNKTYQLEQNSELASNSWNVVTNGIVGTGGILYFPISCGGTKEFYRVKGTP